MMRIVLSTLFVILVNTAPAFAESSSTGDVIPLTTLVQHALEAQPSVGIALSEVERRHQETNTGKSSLYPVLDISSEAANKSNSTNSNEENIESKASLNYRIDDFGVRSENIKKYENTEESSKYDFMQSLIVTSSQTTQSFIKIDKLKQIIAVLDEEKIFYRKMLNDFSLLIDSGVATRSDMRKVQVSIDTLSTQELTYRAQLDTELSKMRNFTGDIITVDNIGRLPAFFDDYKFNINKEYIMKSIRNKSNAYLALYKNIDAAKADMASARNSNYPTIDASINYTDNHPGSNADPDDYKDEFRFGIRVGLNIFNGFKNQSEENKFAARYTQSKLELDNFLIKTQNSIDETSSKYQANMEALSIARRSYDNASKLTELYKEEFKLGQKSLLDLVSSRNESYQAHITIIESSYSIYESKLEQMTLMSSLLDNLKLDSGSIKIGSRSLLR